MIKKSQFRIKNLPDPVSIREPASRLNVDNKFHDPCITNNSAHIEFNDKNLNKVRFIQVNSVPKVGERSAAKYYVDQAVSSIVSEPSLVRNIQDNDFNNFNLTNINSITLKTQEKDDNQVIIKPYRDQFHQENEQSKRSLGIDFYTESSDLVKIYSRQNF